MWRNTVVNDTQVRRCIVEQCSSTNLLLFNPFSTVFNFSLPLFNFSFRNIDTALSPAIPVSMLVPSECCVSIHNIIFLFWFFFFCPFFNQLKINKKKAQLWHLCYYCYFLHINLFEPSKTFSCLICIYFFRFSPILLRFKFHILWIMNSWI